MFENLINDLNSNPIAKKTLIPFIVGVSLTILVLILQRGIPESLFAILFIMPLYIVPIMVVNFFGIEAGLFFSPSGITMDAPILIFFVTFFYYFCITFLIKYLVEKFSFKHKITFGIIFFIIIQIILAIITFIEAASLFAG